MGFGIYGRWISISGGTARAIILKKMEVIEKSFVQTQFESDQHERRIIVRRKATAMQFIRIDRTGSASNVGSFIVLVTLKIERPTCPIRISRLNYFLIIRMIRIIGFADRAAGPTASLRICSFPWESELGWTLSDDTSSRLTNIDSRILLFRATYPNQKCPSK